MDSLSEAMDSEKRELASAKTLPKSKGITKERLFVVASILVTELCERLTYYSVAANLLLFCTSKLKYSSADGSVITLVFGGTVLTLPVIGGYIADSMAGKYNAILNSGLLYVFGLATLIVSAINFTHVFNGDDLSLGARKAFFFVGLSFIAMGTGGIKANVGPFGAQQVADLGADAVQSFFNWYYWFINVGAMIAYSGVAYVQQEIGFDYGFLIPLISMLAALVIFVAAKKRYLQTPIGGSILITSCGVCCETCKNGKRSWDYARKDHGGSYSNQTVDGVISVMKVLPVFIFIIVYWAVYSQMSTSLFLQSERMNISVGQAKLPAAVLNVFNTIIILILIPIMDKLVYPLLAKHGRSPTHLQRIGIGLFLVGTSMLYAAILEIFRKRDISANGYITQELADKTFNASKLTMFAQIPEFALIGASEVFTSVSGLEFAYTQAPKVMQGLIMGLFLMTSGLGNYVASAIVKIVKSWAKDDASDWYPQEPNNGHLEYIMFLLAALTLVNLIFFIIVARWYKYKVSDEESGETSISYENNDEEIKNSNGVDDYAYDNTDTEQWSPQWIETSKM